MKNKIIEISFMTNNVEDRLKLTLFTKYMMYQERRLTEPICDLSNNQF